ncbi:uncharacterized protein LOC134518772 [Chroicocephalus ridibundus]|uniref:uncharacterized protein LOC134518772 n=1 Tax=Chroicocephalus ridibundus TaxID=1192867 RepID=UPI002FDE2DC4
MYPSVPRRALAQPGGAAGWAWISAELQDGHGAWQSCGTATEPGRSMGWAQSPQSCGMGMEPGRAAGRARSLAELRDKHGARQIHGTGTEPGRSMGWAQSAQTCRVGTEPGRSMGRARSLADPWDGHRAHRAVGQLPPRWMLTSSDHADVYLGGFASAAPALGSRGRDGAECFTRCREAAARSCLQRASGNLKHDRLGSLLNSGYFPSDKGQRSLPAAGCAGRARGFRGLSPTPSKGKWAPALCPSLPTH